MEIFLWVLTAIFGLGILFVRSFKMSSILGYVLWGISVVTFVLFEYMQLRRYLDPAWTGAAVAVSGLILIRISFWITKPVKHKKEQ
ncbi:MAG: hypothetical protein K2J63_06555 [Muribaculaceae bacterium]|nr:hypothetical protein [Muribaculaceae bacterium]MDE6794950.1 hypothetical protein [Muribaculaceae bacterium]